MMERIDLINSFLKLISEISKNDIEIDSNIVYSNLINFNIKKEDITHYYDMWISNFEKIRNINIVREKTYIKFTTFKFKNNNSKIKIYLPLDKKHIYKGINELINFFYQNNIIHSTKVFNCIRNDNIIILVDDLFTAEKIRKFVSNNEYIKKGLLVQNPFMFTDNYVALAWDGYLSYNLVLSEWVSDYINELKLINKLELASNSDFFNYLNNKYNSIFIKGININKFISSRNFVNISLELLNYKYITEIIIKLLNENVVLKDYCDIVKKINFDTNEIKKIIANDKENIKINSEQKEIFDFMYLEISKKIGEKDTIKLFKKFIKQQDYRLFTRNNNIRKLIMQNKMTPLVMKKLVYEEMENALVNASIKTVLKYDVIQLGRALFGIKNNDYSAFTNDNNVRNNLRLMVNKDEIDELLNSFIASETNLQPLEDNYWIFIEIINNMIREK